MLLWGNGGVWDINDDVMMVQFPPKNKKAAAMIYYPLLMIFLMKSNSKFIEPVIAELRPSPEWLYS